MRVDRLTPVVRTCLKEEVPGGICVTLELCIDIILVRSVKELIRKYDLELTASTFLILDSDPTSLEIACEWQRCMGGQVTSQPLTLITNYNQLIIDDHL